MEEIIQSNLFYFQSLKGEALIWNLLIIILVLNGILGFIYLSKGFAYFKDELSDDNQSENYRHVIMSAEDRKLRNRINLKKAIHSKEMKCLIHVKWIGWFCYALSILLAIGLIILQMILPSKDAIRIEAMMQQYDVILDDQSDIDVFNLFNYINQRVDHIKKANKGEVYIPIETASTIDQTQLDNIKAFKHSNSVLKSMKLGTAKNAMGWIGFFCIIIPFMIYHSLILFWMMDFEKLQWMFYHQGLIMFILFFGVLLVIISSFMPSKKATQAMLINQFVLKEAQKTYSKEEILEMVNYGERFMMGTYGYQREPQSQEETSAEETK